MSADARPSVTATIATLWRRQRVLTIAFVLVVAFALFFAVRSIVFFVYWSDHRDEPIEGWMTIRYVAHSYRVDPRNLHDALELQPGVPDRRPLAEIARSRGLTLAEMKATLEAAIAEARRRMEAGLPPEPPMKPAEPAQ